ncbi:MAG: hypothetical protein U0174_07885 [Polyangiaceae bacterium]
MSLSSLIVQRGVASVREVEDALARQVLYGGDLATNLLEVARVDEADLTALLSEWFKIPAAPYGELAEPPRELLAAVPAELAIKEALFPLGMEKGALLLAVAEPLDSDNEWQLSSRLAVPIVQRLALAFRVRQGLSRAYKYPLERRYERLIVRLVASDSERRVLTEPPVTKVNAKAPASARADLPDALKKVLFPEQPRVRKKRRGPLTAEVVKVELEHCEDRDAVLDLFFEFARQYFDYTALFMVQGDIAEGREAHGAGVTQIRDLGVPLDLPSILNRARMTRAAVVGRPQPDGVDAVLAADLKRPRGGAVAAIPLSVRTRVVALLYCDNGDDGVTEEDVKVVAACAADAGSAFESLIVRRKLTGNSSRAPAPASTRTPRAGVQVPTPALGVPFLSSMPDSQRIGASGPAGAEDPQRRVTATMAASGKAAPHPSSMMETPPSGSEVPPPSAPFPVAPSSVPPAIVPARISPASLVARPSAPPPEVAVRRPSGPPIPREDRDDHARPLVVPAAPPMPTAISAPAPIESWKPSAEPAPVAPAPAPIESWRPAAQPAPVAPPPRVDSWKPAAPAPAEKPVDVWVPDGNVPTPALPEVDVWQPGDPIRSAPQGAAVLEPSSLHDDATRSLVNQIGRPGSVRPPGPAFVPAHAPNRSHGGVVEELPSIILSVELEHRDLVARICASSDEATELELIRLGGAAMPALMEAFPGPLAVEVRETGPIPKVADCGPVMRVVARQRRVALPFVLPYCDDGHLERRLYATLLLTELAYLETCDVLVRRIVDEEARVRRVAVHATRMLSEQAPRQVLERLAHFAREHRVAPPKRLLVIQAMGELLQPIAVPMLIGLLGDPLAQVAQAARGALVHLSRQDFFDDARKWGSWWTSNVGRHRIEWLIDALLHDETSLRRAAAVELAELTGKQFGLADDASRRDRERIHLRFREWWLTDGRLKFAPPT